MMNSIYKPIAIAAIAMLALVSCKSDPNSPGVEYMPDMYRGPAYETYSTYQGSKPSARNPAVGAIPRNPTGFNESDIIFAPYLLPATDSGYARAATIKNPLAYNQTNVENGKRLYGIYCQHCHGEKGDGNGTLVESGKFGGVPSYYEEVKDLPVGKMFHTITYGKGVMGSHAGQVNPKERWQLIQWVEQLRAAGLGTTIAVDSTKAVTAPSEAMAPASISKEEAQQVAMAAKNLFFETGSNSIKKESFDDLDILAKILTENTDVKCYVDGHTDNAGKPDANLSLSQRRVEEVKKYLASKGINTVRLAGQGYGDTKPVADNTTEAGKSQNRRVEFKLSKL